MLRGSDADADCDNIGYTRDYICQWLDNMGAGARRGFNLASIKVSQQQMNPGGYAKHVRAFKVEHLIHCLRIAGCLRGDRLIDHVVEQTGVLIGMSRGWLRESNVTLPSRSTLGRMRFVLDAGLASMMKGFWAKLLEARGCLLRGFSAKAFGRHIGTGMGMRANQK